MSETETKKTGWKTVGGVLSIIATIFAFAVAHVIGKEGGKVAYSTASNALYDEYSVENVRKAMAQTTVQLHGKEIDKYTRFEQVTFDGDKREVNYQYTLINLSADSFSVDRFKTEVASYLEKNVCKSQKPLLDHNYRVIYSYKTPIGETTDYDLRCL